MDRQFIFTYKNDQNVVPWPLGLNSCLDAIGSGSISVAVLLKVLMATYNTNHINGI